MSQDEDDMMTVAVTYTFVVKARAMTLTPMGQVPKQLASWAAEDLQDVEDAVKAYLVENPLIEPTQIEVLEHPASDNDLPVDACGLCSQRLAAPGHTACSVCA